MQFLLGLISLVIWLYVIFCIFFRQILVDRILSRGRYWHILVIFLLVALVPFAIAAVGQMCGLRNLDLLYNTYMYVPADIQEFQAERNQNIESPSLITTVLYQFRGFGNHFYAGTETGKTWALVIGILGTILFSGLLIPSVLSVIRMRSDNWQWGNARYNIQHSRYAVILGATDDVPELIHRLLSSKESRVSYVIVQSQQNIFNYRQSLQQYLTKGEELRTILYHGGRNTARELEDLRLERASEVYILGDAWSERESDHDSLNMQCIRLIADYLKDKHRRKHRLKCYVQFDYPSTFKSFQYSDLTAVVKSQVEFIALNRYEMWAQRVLVQSGLPGAEQYSPLEGQHRLDAQSDKHVHLVVVGFSRQGAALAIQAAHVAHYPNFVSRGIRTRITVIDASAEREKDVFMAQYENLFALCRWRSYDLGKEADPDQVEWHNGGDDNFIDLEWEFVQGRVESAEVRQWLCRAATRPDAVFTLGVCFANPQQSMSAAFYLPREVYRHAVQVLVWQQSLSDIITAISGAGSPDDARQQMRYNRLRPFGMSGQNFVGPIIDYRLAKLINYAYWRIDDLQLAHVNDIDPATGLPNQESFWRQSAVVDQWSSNYNAQAVPVKLRALGLDLLRSSVSDIERTFREHDPQEIINVEHNRWNVEKLITGYRALTVDEKADFSQKRGTMEYSEYKKHKKALQKGWEMAHLDICPMAELQEVDAPAVEYDLYLTRAYPNIVRLWRQSLRVSSV